MTLVINIRIPHQLIMHLPKETVGRVRAVLIEMLTNDNKEDEHIEDEHIEDDDIEEDDVHQLVTKQRRRMKRKLVHV